MDMKPAIICLLGPPCSGKTTIAEMLQKDGFHVITVGNVLRNSTNNVIQETLARGDYVSAAEFIIPIIKSKLEEKQSLEPLILDGFPRSRIQRRDYRKEFLAYYNTYYIHLQCSDDVCISRVGVRTRSDDSKIRERLSKHHRESFFDPQIDEVNVTSVNADREMDEVHTDITRLIELAIEDNLHEYEKMYDDYY